VTPVIVYTYAKCSTCRDAVTWLRARGVPFEERAIRETPPTLAELREMLGHKGGEIRRLFNTSGLDYRAMGLAARLPDLSEPEALALLRSNGNLVKRPFLLGSGIGLTGFDPNVWAAALKRT
jgi:arsenate reductase (glutaredoxin)